MTAKAQPRYLTPGEYAARMRVSARTVTRHCKAGSIPGAERVGKLWRIPNPDYVRDGREAG